MIVTSFEDVEITVFRGATTWHFVSKIDCFGEQLCLTFGTWKK